MALNRKLTRRGAIVTLAAGLSGCVTGDSGSPEIHLDVSPEDALIDTPLSIHLTGLSAGDQATIGTSFTDADGVTWLSYGQFQADDTGQIDPAEHAPLDGTYEGREPLGLLWSRRPVEPDPSILSPSFDDRFEMRVTAMQDGDSIDETTVTRRIAHPDVRQVDPDHNPGVLFEPPGDGPHPGVLVLHGSGGRPFTELAKLFASHGYAAFALQYFGSSGSQVPNVLERVPLSIVEEGVAWLRDRDRVSGGNVGLIGWSSGGELALLAGTILADISVVIGIVPSGIVFEATDSGPSASSWTHDGEEVPYVPYGLSTRFVADGIASAVRGAPIAIEEYYASGLREADDERIEAATIPVEEIDAPLVLLSGADDAIAPARLSAIVERRREQYDLPVEHYVYEEAGHVIGWPPTFPTTQSTTGPEIREGLAWELGGTPAANAAANADAWHRILTTLEEAFG